jgi:hypothetical protein
MTEKQGFDTIPVIVNLQTALREIGDALVSAGVVQGGVDMPLHQLKQEIRAAQAALARAASEVENS